MIPDSMPELSGGKHLKPEQGACVMELVSLLTGDAWTDFPACTEPAVSRAAQAVNDFTPDEERSAKLLPFLEELMRAKPLPVPVEAPRWAEGSLRAEAHIRDISWARHEAYGYPLTYEYERLDQRHSRMVLSPEYLRAVLDHHAKLLTHFARAEAIHAHRVAAAERRQVVAV
jgi:hypothetical protein